MKFTIHGVFLLIFSIIQSTWLDGIEILNVKPNLFLVYLIIICCFCEKKEGASVGFIFGLILDVLIGRFWGFNAILSMLTGFFLAYFCERVLRKNNVFVIMMMVFFTSFIYETIYGLISFVFGGNMHFGSLLVRVVLPESLFNMVAALVLYFPVKKFTKYLYIDKGESIG